MTANINTQSKPILPQLSKSGLNVSVHPSSKTQSENEQTAIHSIAGVKTGPTTLHTKTDQKTELSNVNKPEESDDEKESSKQVLDDAVQQMNTYVQSINRNLEFKLDNDSGKTVVKVIDSETDELIRQIPNDEALDLAKQLEMGLKSGDIGPGLLLIKAQA